VSGVVIAPARADERIETVVVVVNSPLPGASFDAATWPGEVQTFSTEDLNSHGRPGGLPDALATQFSSVSLTDEQGSSFQPDFDYRGFSASPISGVAEGIAVYQDGVRLNEPFGDNVNWDLIPQFAVARATLQSSNPAFGLNALGGALSLNMKDGFAFDGTQANVSGGSYGNATGSVEFGAQDGPWAFFAAGGETHDQGFRNQSATQLWQGYADLTYRMGAAEVHLSVLAAKNDIGAVGPTPVGLLVASPRAVFTYPQSMANEATMVQLRGQYVLASDFTVSGTIYYRHYLQHLVDGNTTDVQSCDNDDAQLCLEGDGNYPGDALYGTDGLPVPASVLPDGATPGETDFTRTRTDGFGAALQLASSLSLLDRTNSLVVGASFDLGQTRYTAYGELGTLTAALAVIGSSVIIDQGLSPTASPPIEEPIDAEAKNTYLGVYFVDTLDVTKSLALTLSGRLNVALLELSDHLGTALNAGHGFTRFNPGAGATYRVTEDVSVYAGYSESNRAPTPGEVSCANPARPCLLDAFLVDDPALKQVVSHDIEAGLRGDEGKIAWSAGLFETNVGRDILLLQSDVNGFGFFQNAGPTRRQGADLSLTYRNDDWRIRLSYTYLEATFRSALSLPSNSPDAEDGSVAVRRGNTIPLNPANRIIVSSEYQFTPRWHLEADLRAQSGQYLANDMSNQEQKLSGFATFGLTTAYDVTDAVQVYCQVANVFDTRYYTYGGFTDLDGLPQSFHLTNPRAYSPSPGRTFYAGVRATL
jgi:iron complex outermembrane receptor protein